MSKSESCWSSGITLSSLPCCLLAQAATHNIRAFPFNLIITKYYRTASVSRFRGELIVMEADSHYYPSCCLMPWNRRGSLNVSWLAALARRQPMQDSIIYHLSN